MRNDPGYNEGVRPRTLPLLWPVAMALASASLGVAQLSSTISLSNGVEIEVSASLGQPTGMENLRVEMARASGDSFYRIFKDQNNLAIFAYELVVSRSADGNELHFVAKPAEDDFAAQFPYADAGKPVPSLSSDHEFEPLRSDDRGSIGLFEIPGMGLTVADSIHVVVRQDTTASSGGPLRFASLKVSVNGAPPLETAGSVSGRYTMFYIPEQGGYFFSTDPPDGRAFAKVGAIDGKQMRFTIDNTNFECTAAQPILAHAENSDVWVYHDAAYQPVGNWTQQVDSGGAEDPGKVEFFTAASDSLSWWLQ
jgi:hypothetical protein